MPGSAQVRSIDSLDTFRAQLVVYLEKARPLVDEVSGDLRRMQNWLETDRLQHWQREIARRTRILESAQQALLSARIATFRDATPVEQNAVHAARRSVEEAQDKLRILKRWIRDFGPQTESLARQIGALDSSLTQDLPRAIASLTEILRLLEDYSDRHFHPSPPPPATGTNTETPPTPPSPL